MDKLKRSDSNAPCDKAKKEKISKFKGLESYKKELELEAQRRRHDASQTKIEMLESEINALMLMKHEQDFGQNQLKQEYCSITNILKKKKEALRLKQIKKPKVDQLNSKMLSLWQKCNFKQEENVRREKELRKRKANLDDWIHNGHAHLNKAKIKLAKITQMRKSLLDTTNLNQKIKEMTESITKKQAKLVLMKNRETQLIQLNTSKQNLKTLDKEIQQIKNENEAQKMAKSEMAKKLSNIKVEKEDLVAQLCHEKNQYAIQKLQFSKDVESLKQEIEKDEHTIIEEKIELKKSMSTVKKLERQIKKADASYEKYAAKLKKERNKKQLATKPETSTTKCSTRDENEVTIVEEDDKNAISFKSALLNTKPNRNNLYLKRTLSKM